MSNHHRDGNGEGSGTVSASCGASRTLDDAMREPSTTTPDVVVLDQTYEERRQKEVLDPREDLWLSSADGRYNSTIVPLRVGQAPNMEIFHVHKNVLTKAEYFRKALCGDFSEANTQSINLPEEDPAIFHFLVAFLYEGRFVPIQPVASVLHPDGERGKDRDLGLQGPDSDSETVSSDSSTGSDNSARSRRRAQRRQRRQDRRWERLDQKHPGSHRPGCRCPRCFTSIGGQLCWNCGMSRARPLPPPGVPPAAYPGVGPAGARRARRPRHRHDGMPTRPAGGVQPVNPGGRTAANVAGSMANDRIQGEDMRTWLLTYELSLDVYICANKFLMDDFKSAILRYCVDMLETAGSDAAQIEVLCLCRKLYAGVPESDALLKMIFARVGFLQPLLWQRATEETSAFLIGNPEVATLILRETATRREEDIEGRMLPSMDRMARDPVQHYPPNPPMQHHPHMHRMPY